MKFRSAILLGLAFLLCASTQGVGSKKYRIAFAPVVGDKPFVCGKTYAGLGTQHSTVTPTYLRFYISQVQLLDANGKAVPLALDQDGNWQQRDLAFISFEGDNPACAGGSPLDNRVITGTAPVGRYVGMRFVVGIEPALNHVDATVAAPPLDRTEMFWSWQAGYKFMRLDMQVHKGSGALGYYIFETGSAECTGDNAAARCGRTNEAPITLRVADFSRPIAIDVAAMVAGVDVEHDGDCMMEVGQKCGPEAHVMGLDGSRQSIFRAQ